MTPVIINVIATLITAVLLWAVVFDKKHTLRILLFALLLCIVQNSTYILSMHNGDLAPNNTSQVEKKIDETLEYESVIETPVEKVAEKAEKKNIEENKSAKERFNNL